MKNRLYILELEIELPVSLSARTEEVSWWWHARYRPLSFLALHKLHKEEMVYSLPAIECVDRLCDECLIDKQRRTPFPSKAIQRIQARVVAKCGKKMRVLRTDRGEEFTSASFGKYCDEVDMQLHLTTPYSPPEEQGGGVLKSDHHRDNKVTTDDGRDVREVLGRGGHDGHLPPQSVANAKL